MTTVLAVVIGRAGSRGLPGKNALPLLGRPMVCYAIADALNAETVDRVVVSTDGAAIADAAREMGVEVVDRPASLAGDTATVAAAVMHAVEAVDEQPEIVVVLYANVPVRPPGLVDRAVHRLRNTGADSVQSYADVGKHHPYWMVTLDPDGRVAPHHPNTVDRRQDLPPLLLPDGGVIAVTASCLLGADRANPHAFLGRDRRGVETPAGAVVDVDTEADLRVAASMLRQATGATS
ncbi:MAG: acylneuraminate cytidylyltransferase family protein [Planctomycetes bacterium]|nr:acylneuraminate cytidylyltransferase family protein [Planctomycetota bacterium]